MFSWSRPSPTPASAPVPAVSNGSRTRPQPLISRDVHLSSYLGHPVLKPSTRKVSPDDTIYDTVFQTTNGFALIIRVYLPADSSRAPTMTLHGVRASHDWLDIRMKVIGYDPIISDQLWRESNIKLGDAVYSVIHHLQLHPPSILEITDANLKRLQESLTGKHQQQHQRQQQHSGMGGSVGSGSASVASSYSYPSNSMQQQHQQQQQQQKHPRIGSVNSASDHSVETIDEEVSALIPPVPTNFPEIEKMTLSKLKTVINDDSEMDKIIQQTSEVVTLKELKQSIEKSNEDAAESNLLHEQKLKDLQTDLELLKQDLQTKVKLYKELDEKRHALTSPPDVQETIRELNKVKKEAYRESEEMADDWVESGGADVSDFVRRFMEIRSRYHTRAAKAERLEMSM